LKLHYHNIINVDDCKEMSEKYAQLKELSYVNPQPEDSQTRICNHILDKLLKFPFQYLYTYKFIIAIIRYTWGYGGLAEKQGITTCVLTISEPLLANALFLSKGQLLRATKDAERANVIIVKHHKGVRRSDGSYVSNYYLFNKHYDTWIKPKISSHTGDTTV
jgi:hypothetical protein